MRILIVHDFGVLSGGAEQLSIGLREGLRRRGHEAMLFASRACPAPLEHVADYSCYGTMGAARRVLQVANPSAALQLSRVLRTFRPDVVHVRMFLTQLSPLILPLLREVPALLHVINYELTCPLNTKLLPDGAACDRRAGVACHGTGCLPWLGVGRAIVQTRLRRSWMGAFDLVVANSHWTSHRLRAEGERVDTTVWNGVPIRQARAPLRTPPTVAYAGRLVAKKGVDVLLRAMSRVVKQIPEARLLIAGDGESRSMLERLSMSLGLDSSVSFLGHRSRQDLEDALATAWVQAVPSTWAEPFGLVAAETMMRGTAVVASRSGGLTEQVVEGRTGLLVPPGDPDALASALLQVLVDRDVAETMGRAGRVRALAEFTEDGFTDRFVELYRNLAAKIAITSELGRAPVAR